MEKLRGVIVATPTAFTLDNKIDAAAMRKLGKSLVDAGVTGLVPIGGTGESASVDMGQRIDALTATLEAAGGKVPVVPGVVSPGLADTIHTAKALTAAGADALMVIPPYYMRPTQQGIVDYFKRLSDEVDRDIVLYDISFRTGVSLTVETLVKLAEETRVVASKACEGGIGQQLRTIEAVGDKISILSGDECVYPQHLQLGAVGGIVATPCLFPHTWVRIHQLATTGKIEEAKALHARQLPLMKVLFSREHHPAPLKAALGQIGFPQGGTLLPLYPASAETDAMLATVVPELWAQEKALAEATLQPA